MEFELKEGDNSHTGTKDLDKIKKIYILGMSGISALIIFLSVFFMWKFSQIGNVNLADNNLQEQFVYSSSDSDGSMVMVSLLVMVLVLTFLILSHFLVFAPRYKDLKEGMLENKLAKKMIQDQSRENERLLEQLQLNMDTAKFLQKSINQSVKKMRTFFDQSFIVNRPLQVLSGDFIWFKEISPTKALICLGDCVGHGVAGSLLSSLYMNFLNSISKMQMQPDQLLISMDKMIKDHMELSEYSTDDFTCEAGIMLVDKKNRTIDFAGSNTELIIQNGKMDIVKSQRFCVGSNRIQEKPVIQKFELPESTWLVLSTDGFKNMLNEDQKRLGIHGATDFLENCVEEDGVMYGVNLKDKIDAYINNAIRNDDILISGVRI